MELWIIFKKLAKSVKNMEFHFMLTQPLEVLSSPLSKNLAKTNLVNGISEFLLSQALTLISISMGIVQRDLQFWYIEIQKLEEISTSHFQHGQEEYIYLQRLLGQEMEGV